MEINYNSYLINKKLINKIIRQTKYYYTVILNRFKQINNILNEYKNYLANFILNNEFLFYSFESLKYWINLYTIKYNSYIYKIPNYLNHFEQMKKNLTFYNWKC